MQYSFRCILDSEIDVIRDISIHSDASLEDLHKAIVVAFGFRSQEMASFYRTDKDWEQGEEIPLINMNETGNTNEMKDYKLSEIFSEIDRHLLYIYDFFALWTFFIELRKIDDNLSPNESSLIYSLGSLPDKAPDKQFTSDKIENDFEDEFGDDFEDGIEDDFNTESNENDFYS